MNDTCREMQERLRVDNLDLQMDYFNGKCPIQAEDNILGCPFYFRARHGGWSLSIPCEGYDPVGVTFWEPGRIYEDWGEDSSYGHAEPEDIAPVLEESLRKFAALHLKRAAFVGLLAEFGRCKQWASKYLGEMFAEREELLFDGST